MLDQTQQRWHRQCTAAALVFLPQDAQQVQPPTLPKMWSMKTKTIKATAIMMTEVYGSKQHSVSCSPASTWKRGRPIPSTTAADR